MERPASFPWLPWLKTHQLPAETLYIRRLENGLKRPGDPSRPCRHFPSKPPGASTASPPKKRSAKSQAPSRHKIASAATAAKTTQRSVESKAARIAAAKTSVKGDEPKVERVTKRERMPTLLSQAEGASVAEMMQATDWQQHSVRGFLAGTVKNSFRLMHRYRARPTGQLSDGGCACCG